MIRMVLTCGTAVFFMSLPASLQTKNAKPKAPMTSEPSNTELCSATYRAEQISGHVVVIASGSHNTGGFKTFFVQSTHQTSPPAFTLWHVKPTGMVTQALTPFDFAVGFAAKHLVESVVVHDASGKHSVPVEQVRE